MNILNVMNYEENKIMYLNDVRNLYKINLLNVYLVDKIINFVVLGYDLKKVRDFVLAPKLLLDLFPNDYISNIHFFTYFSFLFYLMFLSRFIHCLIIVIHLLLLTNYHFIRNLNIQLNINLVLNILLIYIYLVF